MPLPDSRPGGMKMIDRERASLASVPGQTERGVEWAPSVVGQASDQAGPVRGPLREERPFPFWSTSAHPSADFQRAHDGVSSVLQLRGPSMTELCVTCGEKVTPGGLLTNPNQYLGAGDLRILNFIHRTEYDAMCGKCGGEMRSEAFSTLNEESERLKKFLASAAPDFPMMTISVLPGQAAFRVLGMVTANITVGTGLFNEFSQGFSDFFGSVNTESGMASKVNKGEAAARSILAHKAIEMGANCIIGVDVDYGVTNNNAATVNMQGTAVQVQDVAAVLSPAGCAASEKISAAWKRLRDVQRWLRGRIEDGEIYAS